MRFHKSQFHTWSRILRELPPAHSTIAKFKLHNDAVTIKNLDKLPTGSEVVLNGWIDKKPKKIGRSLSFSLLRDCEGNKLQLVDSKALLKNASVEDVVQAKGFITPKRDAGRNEKDAEITYELRLDSLTTLNGSNKKPSELQDFKTSGNYPPEYRYLQLRLPKYQKMLKKRNLISRNVRDLLNEQGFTEVETPLLFKSTPEGAREFLVPTRKCDQTSKKKPTFYALPQSPQQYKQLLMASGVNRYFQIARCFRDEDLRADRQPEFTQIDLELAFATGREAMEAVENLVVPLWRSYSVENLLTLDKRGRLVSADAEDPIYHMKYSQAMTQYGIDKPDLRAPDLRILDLTEFKAKGYVNKDFPVFEVLVLRKAFDSVETFEKNWAYLSNPNNYNSRTPIIVPIQEKDDQVTWFEKFMSIAAFENPKLISKFLNLQKGDIVCGCTRQASHFLFENPTPMGRLRQLVLQSDLGRKLYQQTNKDVASWVVDFPLFSPNEILSSKNEKQDYPQYDKSAVSSTHHPFTMVKLSDYEDLKTNPLKCSGQHYDLVVSGVEVGGGSTRIHDPELQEYVFENVLKLKNSEELFGHLLQAFNMGTPPHAGFAIGFDRLCAMLCGTDSIRDVIAFPKSVTGADLVVGSPTTVDETVLKTYNIEYSKGS